MGYRQEWCKNMKDRIEDKKDIKLQKEMKQYRKRIYEASGNELAAVLKEIQERMEQEFNVESMVLLFTELSSLLNEKYTCARYVLSSSAISINCFGYMRKRKRYRKKQRLS